MNNDNRTAIASIVFQFRNSEDKPAFIKKVLDDDGPLAEFSYTERLGLVSKLSALETQANAERKAIVRSLGDQLDDAIKSEKNGDKGRHSAALAQQGLAFPELAEKLRDLAEAVTIREALHETRNTTIAQMNN